VTATSGLGVGDATTGYIVNNGTLTITGGNLAVAANATVVNNGTITVSGSLTGLGAFTNATGGYLTIGGSADGITSLIATATSNTVVYSGITPPTCKTTGYYRLYFSGGSVTCAAISIAENLVINGGATWTPSGASLAVGGTVYVSSGSTFTLPGIAVTVTGTSTIAGTINTATATTGTKTFTGLVTVDNTGTWNLSGQNTPATLQGGLTVVSGGTFTAGSGVYTFNTNAQALTGTIVIPSVTITGVVLTNNDTLTTNTALTGTGTMTNAGTLNTGGNVSVATLTNSGTFNISGAGAVSTVLANLTNTGTIALNGTMTIAGITNNTDGIVNLTASGTITAFNNATATSAFHIDASPVPTITTLTVTTAGNTVDYGGAAQTIKNVTYRNLTLSGSGIKTATAADLVVAETLTISGGTLSLATANDSTTANKLYFGTAYQKKGTWGSTGSATPAASYKNDTYFTAAADGLITVALGHTSSSSSGGSSNNSINCAYPKLPVNNTCVDPTPVEPATPATPAVPGETPAVPATPATPGLCPNGKTLASNCTLSPSVQAPVSTTTVLKFTKALNTKSLMADVKNLQQALNEVGGASLGVDGKWGAKTTAAIKKFQKENGFSQVGVVGPQTRAKLNSLLGL
jgi:hypothetical protein